MDLPLHVWLAYGLVFVVWVLFRFSCTKSSVKSTHPAFALVVSSYLIFFPQISSSAQPSLAWQTYSAQKVAVSLGKGSPVLLEFTADWCSNCRVLEKTTYDDPGVIEAANKAGINPFRVDITDFDDEQQTIINKYGGKALPFAVLINHKGEVLKTYLRMFSANSLKENIERLSIRSVGVIDWSSVEGTAMIGRHAPEWFNLNWLDDNPLSLSALRDKVVLVRFWLTGCPFCTRTAPSLREFWQSYKDRGLVVIGIHHPKSEMTKNPKVVKEAARALGFDFPIAMDNSWQTIRAYGVGSELKRFTSVSFLIDQQGIIRFVHDGGEFHLGGGDEHTACQAAYFALKRKIEELLEKSA